MGFYAVPYRVLFHDTMAYGTHHFLTNFKFQCVARETLFFKHIVDSSEQAAQAHRDLVLLTREGYARNLAPVEVGKRVGILVSVENQTHSSIRCCFRVMNEHGEPVTCGYQSLVTVAADTGQVIEAPESVLGKFAEMQESLAPSFQELVHSGKIRKIFPPAIRELGKAIATGQQPEAFLPHPNLTPQTKTEPQTGWLFPGQGSLDPALLRWFLDHSESAKAIVQTADRLSGQLLGKALLPALLDSETGMDNPDPELSQIGIFLNAMLCGQWLIERGRKPDILIGHSAGEIAVLPIAGVLTAEEGIRLAIHRVLGLREVGPGHGGMAMLATDKAQTMALLEQVSPSQLSLAVVNHRQRQVVSGPIDQLDSLLHLAGQAGIDHRKIPSPYPFHNAMLAPAMEPFKRAMAELNFKAPAIPIFSPMANRVLDRNEAWPDLLANHLTQRLDFADSVTSLHRLGVTRFLHCGTNTAMLGLVKPGTENDRPEHFETPFTAKQRANYGGASPAAKPTRPDAMASAASLRQAPVTEEPIAIVAMGCVLPGAHSPQALWDRLLTGEHALAHLDDIQPDLGRDFKSEGGPTPDKTYTLLGGYVQGYTPNFDPDLIAPETYAAWAKGQKLLAGAAHQCKEGLNRTSRHHKAGFYLGATADGLAEYDESLLLARLAGQLETRGHHEQREALESVLGRSLQELERFRPDSAYREVLETVWGQSHSILTVDAACASSIYAVIMGMQALRNRDLDLALCGGVFAPGPANSCLFSQFGGLSATGSRPFDASADGVVFGEGAAILALKRLDQAIRDGDTIHGVLRGYGMSSDGKSASVALPKSRGQFLAIERAYRGSGVAKSSIQAVEAHATATPVGDAVEYGALQQAFAGEPGKNKRALGSLKALLGHTGWVAGAASIIKMTLALEHRQIPAQPRYDRPNPKIDLEAGGFTIPTQTTVWPENGAMPRRCAINGFGFGGTNAHLVLEAFEPAYHAQLRVQPQRREEEVVVVGWHAAFPPALKNRDLSPALGALAMPRHFIVLPDALDDMDRCQRLATLCADGALRGLGELPKSIKSNAGVVLGLEGRCSRGEEVNLRLYRDALAHRIRESGDAGLAQVWPNLDTHIQGLQTSGAYTLPGIMPNVAAGRVANFLDLNGPNLVLSQRGSSLQAALAWSRDRLASGECDLVVAGGLSQYTGVDSLGPNAPELQGNRQPIEAGIALALTTRATAQNQGWPVLGTLALEPGAEQLKPTNIGRTPHYLAGAEGAIEIAETLSAGTSGRWVWPGGKCLTFQTESQPNQKEDTSRPFFAEATLVPSPCPKAPEIAGESWLVVCPTSLKQPLSEWIKAQNNLQVTLVAAEDFSLDPNDGQWEETCLTHLDQQPAPDRILVLADLRGRRHHSMAMSQARRVLNLGFVAAKAHHARLRNGNCQWAALCLSDSGVVPPASGLFSGMAKAFAREFPEANFKALISDGDFSSAMEAMIRVCATSPESGVDWVWREGTAHRWLAKPMDPERGRQPLELDRHSLVIATGGGRGVTAVLVEALLRKTHCHLVLLGRTDPYQCPDEIAAMSDGDFEAFESTFYREQLSRTPKPHPAQLRRQYDWYRRAREVLANLARLKSLGGTVTYLAADLTQTETLTEALKDLAADSAPDLVIHGAGVQVSQSLPKKRLAEFQRAISTKVDGLANLHAAISQCWAGAKPHYHLLTSAFSYFGNDGQPDYGAANEALNRLAVAENTGSGARWTSLAWLGWAGIGMTRGSEYAELMKARGLYAIQADEGAEIFLDCLESNPATAAHILLSQGEMAYFDLAIVEASNPAKTEVQKSRNQTIQFDAGHQTHFQQHLVGGKPVLPGAYLIDLAIEAARKQAGGRAVRGISDIHFLRFVKLPQDRPLTLRLETTPSAGFDGKPYFEVRILSDFHHPNGTLLKKDQVHFRLRAHFEAEAKRPAPPSLPSDQGRALPDPYITHASPVQLSGPFRCLNAIETFPDRQIALYQIPQADLAGLAWSQRTLLLDAIFRLSMLAADDAGNMPIFVPKSSPRVIFHSDTMPDPQSPILLVASSPQITADRASNDWVWALDGNGQPILSLWDLQAEPRGQLTKSQIASPHQETVGSY